MRPASDSRDPDNTRPALELLLGQVESLPVLPAAVERLLALTAPATFSHDAILAILAAEPAAAAMVLHLAGDEPTSLRAAVEMIGPAGAANMALSAAAGATPALELNWTDSCRHSMAVATAAEMIARGLTDENPDRAFLAGLLHDIGKPAIAQCMPKAYSRVLAAAAADKAPLAQHERGTFGLDHASAGRRLAQRWRFPAWLEQAIWLHHADEPAVPQGPFRRLALTVQLADLLVRQRQIGSSGNPNLDGDAIQLAAAISLPPAQLQAVTLGLQSEVAKRWSAAGLDAGKSPNVTAVLADSAADLRRQVAQLQEQLASVQRQAAEHRAVDAFLRDLTWPVEPAAVCAQAAKAFAISCGLTSPKPLLAFALAQDGSVTLAVCHSDGQVQYQVWHVAQPPSAVQEHCPPRRAVPPATARLLLQSLGAPEGLAESLDLDLYSAMMFHDGTRPIGCVLLPTRSVTPAPVLTRCVERVLALAQSLAGREQFAEQLTASSQQLTHARQEQVSAASLAAVAEMAAGAAHELNNPLTVISGRAQLLAMKAGSPQEREMAELIARKAQDISDIATDLLDFARPRPPRPQAVSPANLLEEVRQIVAANSLPKTAGARVDIRIEPDCPAAWADADQLKDVLLELVANAARSAAGGVDVKIVARKRDDGGVLLTVSDNGPGMDANTLASAFMPFFSYRPAGRGRGLGLARARRHIEEGGGRIYIQSRPGQGTTVFLELPAAK